MVPRFRAATVPRPRKAPSSLRQRAETKLRPPHHEGSADESVVFPCLCLDVSRFRALAPSSDGTREELEDRETRRVPARYDKNRALMSLLVGVVVDDNFDEAPDSGFTVAKEEFRERSSR